MDLFEDDTVGGGNEPEFTVSELSGAIRRTLEGGFARVRVRAEVGRVHRARSGHLYFDLKDERAVLSAVTWKGHAAQLDILPEEGMEVVAIGRITTFPGQSKYQMIVEEVRPAGVGALMAMLEQRKAQLQAEGLFDPARKRSLPYLPGIIGVVTSPSGAVIRDILHRLRDRFPRKVLVWPVAVQGKTSAAEVSAAIRGFDALTPGGVLPRPDVLIVARGGGSIEDLWSFNEEIVARAVAECAIPVISAVGHETDTTLIDFVADRRAPTPTAAAEMAVPVRLELLAITGSHGARLLGGLDRALRTRRQRLTDISRALPRGPALIGPLWQRLDRSEEALPRALRRSVEARQARLTQIGAVLRPALMAGDLRDRRRRLDILAQRLEPSLKRRADRAKTGFATVARRLRSDLPRHRLLACREAVERRGRELHRLCTERLSGHRTRLGSLERMRTSLGYVETLRRGFAVVRAGETVVTTAAMATAHAALEIEFADGRVPVERQGAGRDRRRRSEGTGEGSDQGSLF